MQQYTFRNIRTCLHISVPSCPTPTDGKHVASVETDKLYEVGDYYTYECEKYYIYDGDRVSTCLPNLTWSLPPPTCVGKSFITLNHIKLNHISVTADL